MLIWLNHTRLIYLAQSCTWNQLPRISKAFKLLDCPKKFDNFFDLIAPSGEDMYSAWCFVINVWVFIQKLLSDAVRGYVQKIRRCHLLWHNLNSFQYCMICRVEIMLAHRCRSFLVICTLNLQYHVVSCRTPVTTSGRVVFSSISCYVSVGLFMP